jgi:hypothetical protein
MAEGEGMITGAQCLQGSSGGLMVYSCLEFILLRERSMENMTVHTELIEFLGEAAVRLRTEELEAIVVTGWA